MHPGSIGLCRSGQWSGFPTGAFNPILIGKCLVAVGPIAALVFGASLNWPVSALAQEDTPQIFPTGKTLR